MVCLKLILQILLSKLIPGLFNEIKIEIRIDSLQQFLILAGPEHNPSNKRIPLRIQLFILSLESSEFLKISIQVRRNKEILFLEDAHQKRSPLEILLPVTRNIAELAQLACFWDGNAGLEGVSKSEQISLFHGLFLIIHPRNNILINHVLYTEAPLMAEIKILLKRARVVGGRSPKRREKHFD